MQINSSPAFRQKHVKLRFMWNCVGAPDIDAFVGMNPYRSWLVVLQMILAEGKCLCVGALSI